MVESPEHTTQLLADSAGLGLRPFDRSSWSTQAYAGLYGQTGTRATWDEYLAASDVLAQQIHPKGQAPGWMFASTTNLRRRVEDFDTNSTSHALAIDIDEGLPDIAPFLEVLARLKQQGFSYHAQWRDAGHTHKAHLVLPYADPYPIRSLDSVREANIEVTRTVLGADLIFDPAVCKVAGLLFAMTRRPNTNYVVHQALNDSGHAFDMVGYFPVYRQGDSRSGGRRRLSKEEATEQTQIFLKGVTVHEWLDTKGCWDIECPVQHEDDYAGKTYLYPSGHISCMAGRCQGKPMAWFLSHLDESVQDAAQAASRTRLKLELAARPSQTVDVDTAHQQIRTALEATRPVEGHATVVQVSTGAGKTHAVAEYLDTYAAPFEDERRGLAAVMAVPTNALLREVSRRINVEHQTRTGVLAVLNDDGTPACRKHRIAAPLQASGGNVHRLLCGHCEYRDGCPARENTTRGEGSLVLTNHALMVSTAQDYLDAGRHPLLVWDESPPWVQTSNILTRDLDWLLQEFDGEARPTRGLIGIANVTLFSPKYRAAVRPVLEALRWARVAYAGVIEARALLMQWIQIPLHQMLLARALEASGLEPSGDAWRDFCTAYTSAYRLNRVEMGFDTMRPDTQRRVLRAEKLMSALGVMAGENAVLVMDQHSIMLGSLTASGSLYRSHGGVVLDATANLAELRALRADIAVTQCRVRDKGDIERYLIDVAGLDRKSLKHRPGGLGPVLQNAQTTIRRWGRREGLSPKVAVFAYKSVVPEVKVLWPEAEVAWFGNTRGYDRFYQEGFDVFVTLGDPVTNLGSLAMQWRVLTGQTPEADPAAWQAYVASSAESELAQAHGRARDPQHKLGPGGRMHLHYGRRIPAGWDLESTQIDTLTFAEQGLE